LTLRALTVSIRGVLGGVYLENNLPTIALNDFSAETELTHIGTIPSYHMHKLGQKRRGSKINLKQSMQATRTRKLMDITYG
jgi:hypothetical protein